MPKTSNRDKLLTEGLRVVHQRGFAGVGVRDIALAAGVPLGSFTNHFPSKEAFGLEIIDLYLSNSRATIGQTLRNDALPPLERLAQWIDVNRSRQAKNEMRNGCLFGNFTAEASDSSDLIREKLVKIFAEIQAAVAYCLEAAVQKGEISATTNCDAVAGFIVSSLQGANLISKAQRSSVPIDRFKDILFSSILR